MARGEHSIRFDRFYSSSPVCSPTRGSLLTGRNHNRFCIWAANSVGGCGSNARGDSLCHIKYPLPASEVTVAELLKKAGYRTAAIGKWHLGELKSGESYTSSNPGDNGFDVWKVTERAVPTSAPNCGCFNTSLCRLGHQSSRLHRHHRSWPCTNYYGPSSSPEASVSSLVEGHPEIILKDDSEFIADEFSRFLEGVMMDKDSTETQNVPFFAYIPFHSVHKEFVASPPYADMYREDRGTLSQEELDYYASLTAMDAAVGRIRSLLRRYNISTDTMIWFASDNGPANGTPGRTGGLRGRKGSLFEGGIRVPGIIEWPGVIKENRVSGYPVSTSDFVPTVIDMLGLEDSLPAGHVLDGASILPLLLADDETAAEEAVMRNSTIQWAYRIKDFKNSHTAVILENSYKLVARYHGGKVSSYQLFNVKEDPAEASDISEQNHKLSRSLLQQLDQWLSSIKASAEGCLK